jgi:hypothetical protein
VGPEFNPHLGVRLAAKAVSSSGGVRSKALFIGLQSARSGCDNRTSHANRRSTRLRCHRPQVADSVVQPRHLPHTTGTMFQQQTGDSVLAAETLRLASQRSVAVNNTLAQTRRYLARMTSSRREGRSRCTRNRALRPTLLTLWQRIRRS